MINIENIMQRVVGEAISDGLGYTTVAGSIIMTGLEWFGGIGVNEFLHTIASIGGICFVYYKINHLRVEIKIKKQQLKKLNDEE